MKLYGHIELLGKNAIGFTPYHLVDGKQVLLSIELQIHTFKLAADLEIDLSEAQKESVTPRF